MAMDEVTTLCKKYNTDKCRGEFPHSRLYSRLFEKYKNRSISLLEIGVNKGHSVPVWEDYFPNATLQAVDIKEKCLNYISPRTHVSLLDQSDKTALVDYAKERGDFDIVIDDGSHMSSHQILTFEALWPYILPGGTYVVEDTLTSYDERYLDAEQSCVDYFKDRIDDVHLRIDERPALFTDIETIIIKQDMVVVTKR